LSVPVFVPCPAWGVSVSPFLQVRRMKRIDTGLSILFKKVYVMARTCSVTVTQKKEPDSSLRNVCVNPYNKDAPVLTKRLCKSKSHLGRNIATSEPHGRIKTALSYQPHQAKSATLAQRRSNGAPSQRRGTPVSLAVIDCPLRVIP
jgi:hypothetical protein